MIENKIHWIQVPSVYGFSIDERGDEMSALNVLSFEKHF